MPWRVRQAPSLMFHSLSSLPLWPGRTVTALTEKSSCWSSQSSLRRDHRHRRRGGRAVRAMAAVGGTFESDGDGVGGGGALGVGDGEAEGDGAAVAVDLVLRRSNKRALAAMGGTTMNNVEPGVGNGVTTDHWKVRSVTLPSTSKLRKPWRVRWVGPTGYTSSVPASAMGGWFWAVAERRRRRQAGWR